MIYFKKVKTLKTQSLRNFQREMVDTHCLWPLKKERVFPRAHHVLSHLHERRSCLALFSVLCATTQHPDPASSTTLPLNTIWPSSNCHENYLILLETPSCIPFQPFVRNPNSHVRQTRAYRTRAQATVPALPPYFPTPFGAFSDLWWLPGLTCPWNACALSFSRTHSKAFLNLTGV